jgi:hypothetical protein
MCYHAGVVSTVRNVETFVRRGHQAQKAVDNLGAGARLHHHQVTPALQAARRMPPLNHWPGQSFDIMRSEVAQWLCNQPELRQELFNWCKHRGVITYDLETRRWRGVAWEP